MGRIYGGIEEATLLALIRSTIQDHKIIKQVEDLEEQLQTNTTRMEKTLDEIKHRFDKLNSIVMKRPDLATVEAQVQALQLNLKQKADLAEVTEKMSRMEGKVERKLESAELEGAIGGLEGKLKIELEDLEDKFKALYESMEKVETGEILERLILSEQVLQDKADIHYVDAEAKALKQAMSMKADGTEMEERFEEVKQRMRMKAEIANMDEKLSILTHRLHRKIESSDIKAFEDRIAVVEHRTQDPPDFDTVMERVDMIERKMQQKADNAAVDSSLDDLDQRLQLKADDSTVQDRISGIDFRLQSKAETQIIASRLSSLEQRLSREAEDITHIKQELSTKVDAAFVNSNQVYIMNEVETMNITQNKQFNVLNQHGGHSSGSGGSSVSPQMMLQPESNRQPAEGKSRLALQNNSHAEQQVGVRTSTRGGAPRSSRADKADKAQQQQPLQQQLQLQQMPQHQQPLQGVPSPTPRPGLGRLESDRREGAKTQSQRTGRSETPLLLSGRSEVPGARSRSTSRLSARSWSTQGGPSDSEGHSARTNRRRASSVSAAGARSRLAAGHNDPAPGPHHRSPTLSGDRHGGGADRLHSYDSTPPRYRSRSSECTSQLRGKPRSRSVTPSLVGFGSDVSYDETTTPQKNTRLTGAGVGGLQGRLASGRIWACKRM